MSGGMSSIRTGTAPGSSAAGRRCAAARSASLSAAQIQLTSASGATAASPEVTPATRPPPPRRAVSVPSGPNWYDTGPRLDATRTRLFIRGRGGPCRTSPPPGPAPGRADTLISVQTQLHNAHPEGWRDRPCEAPATYRASMPVSGGPAQHGGARDMVPSPARGHGDRWERWGRKSSPVITATPRFGYATGLTCRECGQVCELGPFYACGECFGPLEVGYDYPRLDRAAIEAGPPNMWRYAPLLPVPADIADRPTMQPGYTRLIRADNLAHALGMRRLWIKDDRGNPTHSFKDRVVAVALAAATELGFKVLACPSTGNLANAVAAAAARAGIRSVVLVPANLEPQKILGTAVYGGTLVTVEGSYDDVNRLASELADEREDWAFVNVNVRPYYAEGSKSIGFEIAEQLGWRLPPQIVVPVASGAQLVKVDKGFSELVALGLVPAAPWRVYGAQASGCAPVSEAFAAGYDVVRPVRPSGVAK